MTTWVLILFTRYRGIFAMQEFTSHEKCIAAGNAAMTMNKVNWNGGSYICVEK